MGYIGTKPSAVPLTSADITDGIITSAKIADGTIVNADINASAAIVASKLSGVGITEADMWRITTNTTIATAGTELTSNWERVDTDGFGKIGTGMSQSSGIFTFPSTGVYLIELNTAYRQTINDANYVISTILTTLDNSSYSNATSTLSASRVNDYNTNTLQFIFNVSSTANRKCKFQMTAQVTTVTASGNSDENFTYVSFIRLGDSV
jgi:hypothetical protein